MIELPLKMQKFFEPRPKSPVREIKEFLQANGGCWKTLPVQRRQRKRRQPAK